MLTPLTAETGQWLYNKLSQRQPDTAEHAARGHWMIYFSIGLLVVAIALVVLHWLDEQIGQAENVATVIVAVLALAIGVSSIVGVVRIGDAGAEAVWGRQS